METIIQKLDNKVKKMSKIDVVQYCKEPFTHGDNFHVHKNEFH